MSSYRYILYECNELVADTSDFDYAVYWLLTNTNNDSRIDILYLTKDKNNIYEGSYKFDNGFIRYHKLYPSEYTKYSPYDLSVFKRTDLFLLYLKKITFIWGIFSLL